MPFYAQKQSWEADFRLRAPFSSSQAPKCLKIEFSAIQHLRRFWANGGIHKFKSVLPMPRIPKSVGSGTFLALYGGLPAPNRKLANQLQRPKNREKSKKIKKSIFSKRSKMTSRGPMRPPEWLFLLILIKRNIGFTKPCY